MRRAAYGLTDSLQCSKCSRPAKARGLCTSHYSMDRVARIGAKTCACGKTYRGSMRICQSCYLAQRAMRPKPVAVAVLPAALPEGIEIWRSLRRLKSAEALQQFLGGKEKGEVWPDTDHSLACWLALQGNATERCCCGASMREGA